MGGNIQPSIDQLHRTIETEIKSMIKDAARLQTEPQPTERINDFNLDSLERVQFYLDLESKLEDITGKQISFSESRLQKLTTVGELILYASECVNELYGQSQRPA